jgi:hypothetical protein
MPTTYFARRFLALFLAGTLTPGAFAQEAGDPPAAARPAVPTLDLPAVTAAPAPQALPFWPADLVPNRLGLVGLKERIHGVPFTALPDAGGLVVTLLPASGPVPVARLDLSAGALTCVWAPRPEAVKPGLFADAQERLRDAILVATPTGPGTPYRVALRAPATVPGPIPFAPAIPLAASRTAFALVTVHQATAVRSRALPLLLDPASVAGYELRINHQTVLLRPKADPAVRGLALAPSPRYVVHAGKAADFVLKHVALAPALEVTGDQARLAAELVVAVEPKADAPTWQGAQDAAHAWTEKLRAKEAQVRGLEEKETALKQKQFDLARLTPNQKTALGGDEAVAVLKKQTDHDLKETRAELKKVRADLELVKAEQKKAVQTWDAWRADDAALKGLQVRFRVGACGIRVEAAPGVFAETYRITLPADAPEKAPAEPSPPPPAAPAKPDALGPAEAAQRVGQVCTIAFEVKSTGAGGPRWFLNSEADFSRPGNFTVVVEGTVRQQFATLGVDNLEALAQKYRGQTVRVVGRVELFQGRPQIKLAAADQLALIPGK